MRFIFSPLNNIIINIFLFRNAFYKYLMNKFNKNMISNDLSQRQNLIFSFIISKVSLFNILCLKCLIGCNFYYFPSVSRNEFCFENISNDPGFQIFDRFFRFIIKTIVYCVVY